MKKRLNITLLGHKDHGKSTLIGRFLWDTGNVRQEKLEEIKRFSGTLGKPMEFAFFLDSFREEREGGMTLDVIHAQIEGNRHQYNFIDVPGHEELIKNMLTGASQADAGLLIVSAYEGMEDQTSQHLRLARWLGLKRLIIAVNKMDLAGYDQSKFNKMSEQIYLCLEQLGLREDTRLVPVSAYHGDNVVRSSTRMKWYHGQTLLEHLEALEISNNLLHMPMRFPVQDVYRLDNRTIIAGRAVSGSVRVGQQIMLLPTGDLFKVRAILSSNQEKDFAQAGENIGIELEGDAVRIQRGDVCCDPDDRPSVRKELIANAVFIEGPPKHAVVECGLAKAECDIDLLEKARIGEVSKISLRLNLPMVVENANTMLGRLALKRNGIVIGMAVLF